MKIINDTQLPLTLAPYEDTSGFSGVITLHQAFNLLNPDELYDQVDLAEKLENSLLGEMLLDEGRAKPRSEYLICSHAYSYGAQAIEVKACIGESEKKLLVYGERFWHDFEHSEPKQFKKIPLLYENAYGGKGYGKNPIGKGLKEVTYMNNEEVLPLPNIELSDELITSVLDTPSQPAGFMPLDVSWDQRREHLKHYPIEWVHEQWPAIPDNENKENRMRAPKDQRFECYFKGDETFTLHHMHPEYKTITGSLPQKNIRCFALRQDGKDEVFEEVALTKETLWLFPDLEIGVLTLRGVLQVSDEAYTNLHALYATYEEEGKPFEAYKNECYSLISADDKETTNEETEDENLSETPKLNEKETAFAPLAASFKLQEMHGERCGIKRSSIEYTTTDTLPEAVRNSASVQEPLQNMLIWFDNNGMYKKLRQKAQERFDKEALTHPLIQNYIYRYPQLYHKETPKPETFLLAFLNEGVKYLQNCHELKDEALAKGLFEGTLEMAWMGYNPAMLLLPAEAWGGERELRLPQGWMFGRFENDALCSVRIRKDDPNGKSVALIELKKEPPLLLQEETECHKPLFWAGNAEYEAWLIFQEIWDVCDVIACETPDQNHLNTQPVLMIEGQEPQNTAFACERVDLEGKPLKECIGIEDTFRQKVLTTLKSSANVSLPASQSKGTLVEQIQTHVNTLIPSSGTVTSAYVQPLLSSKARVVFNTLTDRNTTLSPSDAKMLLGEVTDNASKALANHEQTKEAAQTLGQHATRFKANTPSKPAPPMTEAAEMLTRESVIALYAQGADFSNRELRGLDLSNLDLNHINLSSANILTTDFTDTNLDGAMLENVTAQQCNFTRSDLSHASLQWADFELCRFKEAVFEQTNAEGSVLNECTFDALKARHSSFASSSFFDGNAFISGSFEACDFTSVSFIKTAFDGISFVSSVLDDASLLECHALACDFSKIRARKLSINQSRLHSCLFNNADVSGSTILMSTLEKSSFCNAIGHEIGIYAECGFEGSDFSSANLQDSTLLESSFQQSNFSKSILTNTLVQNSDFSESDFRGACAKSARFEWSDLSKSDLRGIDLFEGSLRRSHIHGCDAAEANLYDTEFFRTNTTKTCFKNAHFSAMAFKSKQEVCNDEK